VVPGVSFLFFFSVGFVILFHYNILADEIVFNFSLVFLVYFFLLFFFLCRKAKKSNACGIIKFTSQYRSRFGKFPRLF